MANHVPIRDIVQQKSSPKIAVHRDTKDSVITIQRKENTVSLFISTLITLHITRKNHNVTTLRKIVTKRTKEKKSRRTPSTYEGLGTRANLLPRNRENRTQSRCSFPLITLHITRKNHNAAQIPSRPRRKIGFRQRTTNSGDC